MEFRVETALGHVRERIDQLFDSFPAPTVRAMAASIEDAAKGGDGAESDRMRRHGA